jgi:NAD(P)-dependent dehydrogenase (short-subunit alcohol dehydrogenase family)
VLPKPKVAGSKPVVRFKTGMRTQTRRPSIMGRISEIRPAPPPDTTALTGQTVVVIGGTRGIGLEVARRARGAGAEVVVTGRDRERLDAAARELKALRSAAFDATDEQALEGFLSALEAPVDHVFVAAGAAYYASLDEMNFGRARRAFDQHVWLPLQVARQAPLRPGGSLLFITGTGARATGRGLSIMSTLAAGLHALVANLAVELAPVRVNLIAAGFVDTPLSAELAGDDIEALRAELRETLPIRRLVGPADVAALALHLMTNTALTGASYEIDGGQLLLPAH